MNIRNYEETMNPETEETTMNVHGECSQFRKWTRDVAKLT